MEHKKRVGPQAASLKYDLLTALTVSGLHGSPTEQTSLMRLTALITARYNWRLEEVSIGQAELARLWAVNERTVKREMKRLLGMGVLSCTRPGVRGRVGAYRLNYRRIYELSRGVWLSVGPDFEDRMIELSGEKTVVTVNFSNRSTADTNGPLEPVQAGSWAAVRRRLKAEDPAVFESWFAKLAEVARTDQSLTLRTPSAFASRYIETHFATKLARAVEAEMPTPLGHPRRIILTD